MPTRPYTFTRWADHQVAPKEAWNDLQAAIETIDLTGTTFTGYGGGGGGGDVGSLMRPESFGTSTTDWSAIFKSAHDAILALGGGGALLLASGKNYPIAAPITGWSDGVGIIGQGYGSTNIKNQPPTIMNNIPSADPIMIEGSDPDGAGVTSAARNGIRFANVCFDGWNGSGARSSANMAGTALKFHDRLDYSCGLFDCQFRNFTSNPVRFEDGGLNVFIHRIRFDRMKAHGIYWRCQSNDNMSIRDCTMDNFDPRQTSQNLGTGGGLLQVDVTNSSASPFRFRGQFSNLTKLELNCDLPSDTSGVFEFLAKDGSGVEFMLTFQDVFVQPNGTGDTNYAGNRTANRYNGIVMNPAYDLVNMRLDNYIGTVIGIPHYASAFQRGGSGMRHVFAAIAPLTQTTGTNSSNSPNQEAASEIVGELNVIGSVRQFGKKVSTVINGGITNADWPSAPVLVDVGQEFVTNATLDATVTSLSRSICLVAGTLGPTPTATATTNGTSTVTVTDITHLKVGMYIFLSNQPSTRRRITDVRPNALQIVLDGSPPAGGPGLTIAWSPPTFKSWTQAVT